MFQSRLAPLTAHPRPLALLSALALAGLACACGSKTASAPSQPSAEAWAVVDGREIRGSDVETAYKRMGQPNPPQSDEEVLTAKLSLLDELIVQDILVAKASEFKLEVADAELEAAFADRRKNLPDDAFQQELARRNLTVADMRDGIRLELLAQKVLDREVGSKVTVTDQDLTDFFNANRAQFNLTEDAYHIAQIVVTPVREPEPTNRTGDDATTPEEASRKAQMLMEKLKGGTPFAELALDYSEDPQSSGRGGDLGLVPVSALNKAPQALRDAVLKSSPGTVSTVSGGGGHSLVLTVSREAAGQRDLTTPEVRDGITATLRGRREQLLRAAYIGAVRSDAMVVNYIARRVLESPGKLPSLMPAAPGSK